MGLLTLAVLACVPLTGGSLRQLIRLPLALSWLLPLALGLQVLVINVIPGAPEPVPVAVHLATYGLAALFLWRNQHIAGVPLLALGGVVNGIAISANGGRLPASASALRRAGWDPAGTNFANSAVLEHPHLAWLGDNFAIAAQVPFANVFSIGDVMIMLGALVVVYRGSRPPSGDEPRERSATGRLGRREVDAARGGPHVGVDHQPGQVGSEHLRRPAQ
jgi:Family of unknown function (DUF5317)